MDEDKNKTEDQNPNNEPTGKQLISQEELEEWKNDEDWELPKTRDEADEDNKEDAENDEEKDAKDTKDDDTEDEAVEELGELDDQDVLGVQEVEDPGDYQPADYSFDVVTYDAEGNNPKIHKIKTPEDADKLLEDDPNFGSAKNLLDFQRRVSKMENNLDRDKEKWQEKSDLYKKQGEVARERAATVERIANGINYLVSKGKLPKVDAKYANADWSDPQVAKQPGVKEQLALLDYMVKENKVRAKAGVELLTGAVDTYNAMMQDDKYQEAVKTKQQAGEQRKKNGGKVAGTTTSPRAVAPKGIAVGRGGALRDLDSGW